MYHSVFEIFNIDGNYSILLDIFHWAQLISQSRTHNVCTLEHKFSCSRIDCESWKDIGVHVDELEWGDGFLLNPYKVIVIIDNDMFALLLVPCFHLKGHDFGFLVPEYSDLLLGKFRFAQDGLPHCLCLGFTDCLFMTCLIWFFQHAF